jgi:hypothetical protein
MKRVLLLPILSLEGVQQQHGCGVLSPVSEFTRKITEPGLVNIDENKACATAVPQVSLTARGQTNWVRRCAIPCHSDGRYRRCTTNAPLRSMLQPRLVGSGTPRARDLCGFSRSCDVLSMNPPCNRETRAGWHDPSVRQLHD